MKVYIATQLANAPAQQKLANFLHSHGVELTFDWTKQDNQLTTDRTFTEEELSQHSVNDLEGVRAADVLIVLLPGAFGTYVELGGAIMSGKRVIVVGEQLWNNQYDCLFVHHPNVIRLSYGDSLYHSILFYLDLLVQEQK